jgi:hypothetical protein
MTTHVQKFAADKEAREQLKMQLAEYLAGQPESKQTTHKWMRFLEAAGMGIIVATFLVALYFSITWKSINPILIPVAWFVFAASVAPAMIFVGLDAITLKAFPPVVWLGKLPKFVTGSNAVWAGWGFILLALVIAAFWGFFAYSVGTFNMTMLEPLIRIFSGVVGVVITVSILYAMFQKVSQHK